MAKRGSVVVDALLKSGGFRRGAEEVIASTKKLNTGFEGMKKASLDARDAALKQEVAQNRLKTALARTGAESVQARRAQLNLERAELRAAEAAHKAERGHGLLAKGLKRAAGAAAAAAGAYAGLSVLKDSVHTTEELGKTTLTLHKSFGMTVKSASQWAAVARARGAEGKALTLGFKSLSKQASAARDAVAQHTDAYKALVAKQELAVKQAKASGASEEKLTALREKQKLALTQLAGKSNDAMRTFAKLGISQDDLAKHGGNMEWVLRNVAKGMGNLPTTTDKAALAAKLFGRTWTAIAPMVRAGTKQLDEQLAMAEKYGVTFNGKTIRSVEDLIKAQREQKLATMGLQLAIGTTLIPALTKLTVKANAFALKIRREWPQIREVVEPIAKDIGGIATGIGNFLKKHSDVARLAAEFAIIGGATSKLLKLTGAGSILKLGFGRGNTPMTPMYVADVTGGGGPGKWKAGKLLLTLGPAGAATAAAAYGNQTRAFGKGPLVGTGLPAPNSPGSSFAQRAAGAIAKSLGITTPALDTSATTRSAVKARQSIIASWRRLARETDVSFGDIAQNVERNMPRVRRAMRTGSAAGVQALTTNFGKAVDAVKDAMRESRVSVSRGMDQINSLLATETKKLGVQIVWGNASQGPAGNTLTSSNVFDTGMPAKKNGRAGGGWIGAPGRAGRDTVPAMLGEGEAVLNRHQQKPVEYALRSTFGMGLGDLFQQVTTPHYFAKGGQLPRVRYRGPGGVMDDIGQAAIDRAWHRANRAYRKAQRFGDPRGGAAGTSEMDGVRVATWIHRILQVARRDGVPFRVSSGFRSFAEQTRLWNQLGRDPAVVARPGTSNHEGAKYPRGAVDISPGWGALDSWLQRHPQGKWLHHYGEPRDPYHFSASGHAKGGWITKRGTWYGGPNDSGDNNRPASGIPNTVPGIAIWGDTPRGRASLGSWYEVKYHGKTIRARHTDIGPGDWQNRIDINYTLARKFVGDERKFDGQVSARRVNGPAPKEWKAEHKKLEKQWTAERKRSQPRSHVLLDIAQKGAAVTLQAMRSENGANRKDAREHHERWMSRTTFARRAVGRRRRANARALVQKRREENADRLGNYLEGQYLVASQTPGMDDDAAAAGNGYRYWQGRTNALLDDWKAGRLRDPNVLSEAISQRDSWKERAGAGSGAGDTNQAILDELRRMNARAEVIGNSANGALAQAVSAVVSGQIGGKVGLAFATPSYTGNYARY